MLARKPNEAKDIIITESPMAVPKDVMSGGDVSGWRTVGIRRKINEIVAAVIR